MKFEPPAFEAIALTKVFITGSVRVEALRGINLRAERGQLIAIMGPSGSGKSTLLHLIGGLDAPTSGQVRIGETDLGALDDNRRSLFRRRQVGFIFQDFSLLDVLSAAENTALPSLIDGLSEAEAHQRALAALEWVDLAHRADHLPGQLSGGEQQRVAIARALVTKPLLLLADEPTGNWSPLQSGRQPRTDLAPQAEEIQGTPIRRFKEGSSRRARHRTRIVLKP